MPNSKPSAQFDADDKQKRLVVLQELADLSQELDLDRLAPKLAAMDEITRINEKWGLYEWKLDVEIDNSP